MTDDDIKALLFKIGVLIVIGMVIQLTVIGYVFYSGYEGRKALVTSQRAGCARGILDRSANAQGWRSAEVARLTSGNFTTAEEYDSIASGLEERSQIDCKKVYPKAGIFP